MEDLSGEARFGPWVTSQAGGNMVSSNERAMTALGGQPADPLPDRAHQGDPEVAVADKSRAVLTRGVPYAPAPAVWKTVQ
jgi:hypothetical protein